MQLALELRSGRVGFSGGGSWREAKKNIKRNKTEAGLFKLTAYYATMMSFSFDSSIIRGQFFLLFNTLH